MVRVSTFETICMTSRVFYCNCSFFFSVINYCPWRQEIFLWVILFLIDFLFTSMHVTYSVQRIRVCCVFHKWRHNFFCFLHLSYNDNTLFPLTLSIHFTDEHYTLCFYKDFYKIDSWLVRHIEICLEHCFPWFIRLCKELMLHSI